ncbi:hypothetical protein BU24DRAFT_351157 [Aaosphaeria arxii CBS 175.79]|uniref:Nuclear pore complex subunit Nup133 n=1 Tax=Aaosphaeria arxii CBS 175.79 TaxID=1450172 RepID=A0A6A5XLD5_9PLEO|nr:uncharacterized protein BU24DRAFT_351157 [Aaosphaeria arxii CBS 175.79]KAF2013706.1 hypothetical protein BU24DRAFT_351157 [Aaosphaeria arxii CBS 175.79]
MFSPEASVRSVRGSNPRRRQRKDSDGPHQPRRKRSKISEEIFHKPKESHINGNGSAILNGHIDQDDVDASLVVLDLPVRDKKAPVKRAVKEDTGLYLTKNEDYSVRKLPSFPAVLSSGSTPFRGSALPSAGLALALTTNHALVWDYTSATGPTKVLTLSLPFGLKPSDPLPLGAVVRNGPTNDFGILAIAPSTGKISFWENVDSAEARSHFPQRHQGVDGLVKLYSGETITDVVDVEHAGYVLVLSSGRLAQLTLRDSQGRPSINATALHMPSSSSGSFFSLKGLLGSAIRRSIASVKARTSESRGQMEVISATKTGVFQLWDLSWSGQQIFKYEVDVQSEILAAIQSGTPPESRGQQELHVLDFAISEHSKAQGINILMLVALSGRGFLEYTLLEVDLQGDAGVVSRAIQIRNLQQNPLPKEPTGKLLLPQSGQTAFVQFPNAVAIVSLAEPEASPDAQLLSDSGKPSLPFQDIIYFRSDRSVEVCGSALESPSKKEKRSSVALFVQGYGVVQFSALHSSADSKVTARSKLEQATFFSTVPDNILDFTVQSRHAFAQDEVEAAAVDISSEILSSSFEYVEKVTSSMGDQMRKRCFALNTLISHLRSDYPPLSFPTKWKLLWNAEKLAAALALWNDHQERLRDQQARPDAYPENLLLPYMVKCVHEKFKTVINADLGETDPLRQWFLRDVGMINILLPWAWQSLRLLHSKNQSKERSVIMQRLSEGNDVILGALEAVIKFREENADLYGLPPNSLRDGVLEPGQGLDLLPEFWTSTHNMVATVRSMVDFGRNLAEESFEKEIQEDLAMKIAKDNPRLVRLECQMHIERFQWAMEQADEQRKEMGRNLKDEWNSKVRPEHIYNLVDIGMATEGMNLAETYHDMPTLVRLIWDETKYMEESKLSSQSKMEQAECTIKLNRIKERIHRYFEMYGQAWAEAFYTQYITEGQSGQIFMKDYLNQPALTAYLRADPSRAKLTWMNEVTGEREFESAFNALYHVGVMQESNAWCKKVELSIAKLAMLSRQEMKPDSDDEEPLKPRQEHKLLKVSHSLEYSKVQDQIYDRLVPFIQEALDDESAIRLLMAEFGQGALVEKPAHQQLLQQGFENLINNRVLEPALLIDVLTLIDYSDSADQFALALKALALSWDGMQKATRENLAKLIWKRLLIKDDWAEINNTKDVADSQLNKFLMESTHVGITLQILLQYVADDAIYQNVWPRDVDALVGAGCTNGELCVRFASEDLRNPIIADNLADDQILQTNIEKYRLNEWFSNVCNVAQQVHHAGGLEELAAAQLANGFDEVVEGDIVEQIAEEQGDVSMQD